MRLQQALEILTGVLDRYASELYQDLLASQGFVCSMSRKGNCWDNAVAEVTLSRRMDDSVSVCEFTYRKGSKAGQNEIDIDCR